MDQRPQLSSSPNNHGNQQCLWLIIGCWVCRENRFPFVCHRHCAPFHHPSVSWITFLVTMNWTEYVLTSISIWNFTEFDCWSRLLNFSLSLSYRTGFYSSWLVLPGICDLWPLTYLAQHAARYVIHLFNWIFTFMTCAYN